MAKNPKNADRSAIIRELEADGYVVKRRIDYVKKTFDIDAARLEAVNKVREELGLTLREVFTESLDLWLEKHRRAV